MGDESNLKALEVIESLLARMREKSEKDLMAIEGALKKTEPESEEQLAVIAIRQGYLKCFNGVLDEMTEVTLSLMVAHMLGGE